MKDNLSHPISAEVKNVHSFTSTPAHISVPWWLGQEANLPLTVTSVLVYNVISTNKVFYLLSTNTGLFKLKYMLQCTPYKV
jgi:hypothetical protein